MGAPSYHVGKNNEQGYWVGFVYDPLFKGSPKEIAYQILSRIRKNNSVGNHNIYYVYPFKIDFGFIKSQMLTCQFSLGVESVDETDYHQLAKDISKEIERLISFL